MSRTDHLTLRQEKFVQALTTPNTPTYCNASAAYRAISPAIPPASSWVGSSRMLGNVTVSNAVKGQLGLAEMGRELKRCLRVAKSVQKSADPSLKLSATRETRDTIMDYAKLTGQLVEKREVKTITDEESQAITALVHASLRIPLGRLVTDSPSDSVPAPVEPTKTD